MSEFEVGNVEVGSEKQIFSLENKEILKMIMVSGTAKTLKW